MYLIEFICQHYGYSDFIANGLIMSGKVLVNDEVCIWGKYKINEKDQIRIKNKQKKFVNFYHVGAKETNRKPVVEALLTNYAVTGKSNKTINVNGQVSMFDVENVRSILP